MNDTYEDAKTTIALLAGEAFERHELFGEGEGRWVCSRPRGDRLRSTYWFRVIVAPYVVIVVGDLGVAIFECSDRDSLAWLRGAAKPGEGEYLRSKLRFCAGGAREFYVGDALRIARDIIVGYDEPREVPTYFQAFADAVADHGGDLTEHDWHELVNEHSLDVDYHSMPMKASSRALWLTHALQTFVRLEAAQAQPAQEGAAS